MREKRGERRGEERREERGEERRERGEREEQREERGESREVVVIKPVLVAMVSDFDQRHFGSCSS